MPVVSRKYFATFAQGLVATAQWPSVAQMRASPHACGQTRNCATIACKRGSAPRATAKDRFLVCEIISAVLRALPRNFFAEANLACALHSKRAAVAAAARGDADASLPCRPNLRATPNAMRVGNLRHLQCMRRARRSRACARCQVAKSYGFMAQSHAATAAHALGIGELTLQSPPRETSVAANCKTSLVTA